ncbi:MAG: helix-turn-helix domain-containing protein, partial [Candidatus Syntrophosphaera sp.]
EERGISYTQVFEDLRLREEIIRLMEDNRFFEIGPHGMVRALMFKYAGYLEADLDAVMNELNVMMPEHAKGEFKPKRPVREKKILLSTNFFWLIGIILIVAILAAILWHAYTRGWLEMPDVFRASSADTTVVQTPETEPAEPDPMRVRQRQISESLARENPTLPDGEEEVLDAIRDSTDYLGRILGPSQVNVPLP